MIRVDPSLVVRRMVVKRGTDTANDEKFHLGVNIIRGENSSGKSTILNFIFYGLGGDLNKLDWSEHALLCDHVWLEVELNGNPAVLRRKIDVTPQSAMEIFSGRYDQASEAPIESWKDTLTLAQKIKKVSLRPFFVCSVCRMWRWRVHPILPYTRYFGYCTGINFLQSTVFSDLKDTILKTCAKPLAISSVALSIQKYMNFSS